MEVATHKYYDKKYIATNSFYTLLEAVNCNQKWRKLMSLKDTFNSLFSYKPENNYQFLIAENTHLSSKIRNEQTDKNNQNINIFPSLTINIEYMKTRYNLLINSDIILREFTMNAQGKQYDAFLVYIDGMVDSKIMDDFILKPLMLRNQNNLFDGSQKKIISETTNNNVTIRKIKRFDLPNYLMGCLLPQNAVKQITTFDEATNGINSRKLCFIY